VKEGPTNRFFGAACWMTLAFFWLLFQDWAEASVRATAYRASADTLYVDVRINQPGERSTVVEYAGCVDHPTEFGIWQGCAKREERRVRLHRGRARVGLWVQRLEIPEPGFGAALRPYSIRAMRPRPAATDSAVVRAAGVTRWGIRPVQQHREDGA
jgi:hypothetical protein